MMLFTVVQLSPCWVLPLSGMPVPESSAIATAGMGEHGMCRAQDPSYCSQWHCASALRCAVRQVEVRMWALHAIVWLTHVRRTLGMALLGRRSRGNPLEDGKALGLADLAQLPAEAEAARA